jgi:hypothetical protein
MSSSFNFYLGAASFSLVLAKRNDVLHSICAETKSQCAVQIAGNRPAMASICEAMIGGVLEWV